jgi:hypothetical protein
MKQSVSLRVLGAALLGGLLLSLVSVQAEANLERWIDKLHGYLLIQKGTEREGNFDLYIEQLGVMRGALRAEVSQRGELRATYAAMSRFMDMLKAREGNISPEAAKAIWNFCYQVAPIALHYDGPYR